MDEGDKFLYSMRKSCNGTSSECNHLMELEFMTSRLKQYELEEKYGMRSDASRYKLLVEELTKERNELKQQLSETEFEVAQVLSERGTVLKENDNLIKELDKVSKLKEEYAKDCAALKEKLEFLSPSDDLSASKDKMTYLSLSGANQEIERLKKALDKVKTELSKAIEESELAKTRRDQAISEREKIVNERDSVRNLCDELRKERDSATSNLLAAIRDKDEAFKRIEQLKEKLEALSNAKKADHETKDFKNSTELNRYSKMVNSCTQTESNFDGKRSVENSFLQIVPFVPSMGTSSTLDSPPDMQMLSNNKFDHEANSPNSSKSASKLSGMLQRFREKFSHNNKENDEHDAIANLDRILDSQDSLQDSLQDIPTGSGSKRNKNEPAKSWPRATIMMPEDPRNHSGTVVVSRKRERPRLYLIPTEEIQGNSKSNENQQNREMAPDFKAVDSFFNPPPSSQPVMRSNRNSNPLPVAQLHHQFLARDKAPPRSNNPNNSQQYAHSIHEQAKILNKTQNRLSLNLNTAKMPHFSHLQGNFMPIKNCNSIESTTMSKSPVEMSTDYQNNQKINKYFNTYLNNKYEFVSDNENFSSSGGVSVNDSLNNNSTNTLPSRQSRNRMNYQASGGSGSGMSSLYNHIPQQWPDMMNSMNQDSNSLHSMESGYHVVRQTRTQLSREDVVPPIQYQETGTFPRKKDNAQRFRNQLQNIPPKQNKYSNNSLDYCGTPDRCSPMPTFQVQIISPGNVSRNKRNTMHEYRYGYKPNIGELRRVHIDKSEKPLGIKIRCRNNGGGVFVSNVGENSIASQVGLQIGDQLLEVCGINMRLATYDLAASVLRQCGNSITMLVQYLPDKYVELSTSDENVSRSDDSTPRNSPKVTRSFISSDSTQSSRMQQIQQPPEPSHSTQTLKSQRSVMNPMQLQKNIGTLSNNSNNLYTKEQMQMSHMSNSSTLGKESPRLIYIETRKCPNLGISLLGGNAFGIFIHSVKKNSIAENVGLRPGDQILEYNGKDLRRATAEDAAFELAKPADKVTAQVQYNIQKFNQIKDKPGDSFYIRVGFDRNSELSESELSFSKDDVLYVDNTMFRGVSGHWRAWKLDEYGHRLECGIIPSQMKVDEELRILGDSADDGSSTRSRSSARRSFFKRIKPQRGSSRDYKELASFSNTHLSLYLDASLTDERTISYQKVERLEYKYRPVIVIGALSEWVVEKLTSDFPEQFHRLRYLEQIKSSKEEMEMRLKNNTIIEYRRKGSLYECVSLQAVKDNKNSHCILDVNISAVERLHRNQVYPIVLLLRFKSAKQIKEIKYSSDKISAKVCKEMYEHSLKLESEYKQYISAIIPAGVNITHMSLQIKDAVVIEQKKILWISTNS